MNTLKSICYYKYASNCAMCAAGDDVILSGDCRDSVRANTSPNNMTDSPLGQIVKEVVVTSDNEAFEFCSKWFFRTNQGLKVTRDFRKILMTKQYLS